MPSMRKHGFSAILLLSLITLSIFSWLQFAGRRVNLPAQYGPEFALKKPSGLDAQIATPLPDLLVEDNIPLDTNPTETLDLIGGPKSAPVNTNGPRPPGNKAQDFPSGSKTILIDGQPITKAGALGGSSSPLTQAPIQGISRMTPFGRVPAIATDGRTVLNTYAKPFKPIAGQKYIALIIGGLGLDANITMRAINELPPEISLSFAAQTTDLQAWINMARTNGHEVLIELPMENEDFDAASPKATYTLNQHNPHSANIRNLDYHFSRAEGYFAVTNYGGDALLENESVLSPILAHIKNAGLGFIYDGSVSKSRAAHVATQSKLPFVSAHTMIDNTSHSKSKVRSNISTLPAHETVVVVGMGFAYAGTIDGILAWLQSPGAVKLAPASFAFAEK